MHKWTKTQLKKLLLLCCIDPKTDTLWTAISRDLHPDGHKAAAVKSLLELDFEKRGREENLRNFIFTIRHLLYYWMSCYGYAEERDDSAEKTSKADGRKRVGN